MDIRLPSNNNNRRPSAAPSMTWVIAAGLGITLGGILIATVTPLIFPQQGSAEARQVDNLFRFMLAIGGAIFLLVQGLIVFSVVRFRAKPGDISDGPPMHGNTTLELVWTVIPAIIVTIITVYALQVYTDTRSIKPNEQEVGAVGARYAWSFVYDIPRDSLPTNIDFTTLDPAIQADFEEDDTVRFTSTQLHTWVDQPMSVRIDAEDVNHAFWVPGMRVKQDALVGRTTNIRFTPIEAGTFRIVCAELCGSGHGNMAGEVTPGGELRGAWLIVHPDEETFLREFFEPQRTASLFPPEDPALRGRSILASGRYPCSTCHALDDLGWVGAIGPNLNAVASTERVENRLAATGYETMEEYLHSSIRVPGEYLVPGYNNLMNQFNDAEPLNVNNDNAEANWMPEDDLTDIIAYLLTRTGE